ANRLASAVLPSGQRATFLYKQDGLRHSRQLGSRSEVTLWDGNDVRAWLGSATTQMFVQGHDLSRAVGDRAGAPVNRQYHQDALGTELAITDGSQTKEASYVIDAWGNVISGSAAENPAQYVGGHGYWTDPDLALDYVRARWLEPETGRWLSVDPVMGEARYGYAANEPTENIDPSGTQVNKRALSKTDLQRFALWWLINPEEPGPTWQ